MAAILNGFLPSRKKDQYSQDRILNTRWGDASISAPIHGGWSATSTTQPQSSPEFDKDLPPTPPQDQIGQDGVFVVHDDDEYRHDSEDDRTGADRDNITITIPLPWKKKNKASHIRKTSINSVLNPRYGASKRIEMTLPQLATAEAAASIPLPESRVTSPVGRSATTSPVLSFRSRLASPNLGDMLSPVAEGFAKSGPSSRPTPVLSPLQFAQAMPMDRPSTASSMRQTMPRRPSVGSNAAEGLGAITMTSQGTPNGQALEYQRPPSRGGIGITSHMRSSSRGPRATSRGPRAPSVEPFARAPQSIEYLDQRMDYGAVEAVSHDIYDAEPVRRRAPSIEPSRRRELSVEPSRQREESVERGSRRAPSIGPNLNRRAISREPRGRRGVSVEPRPKVRFHSEAPRRVQRRSISSNDGSDESGDEREQSSDTESFFRSSRSERKSKSSRRPRRRRSIASPMSSPTAATFGLSETETSPPLNATYESITARAGFANETHAPTVQRSVPRNRSQSRTRGLYAEMQDDFKLLGRDVRLHTGSSTVVNAPEPTLAASPIVAQAPPSIFSVGSHRAASPIFAQQSPNVFTSATQRTPSPALSSHPTNPSTISTLRVEPERPGYTSDSSLTQAASVSSHGSERQTDQAGGKALLVALARERKEQLRREERERVRDKVTRKLERDRERVLAMSALSDCESIASNGHMSGSDKTNTNTNRKKAYNQGVDSDTDYHAKKASGDAQTLVPNAEEIWG